MIFDEFKLASAEGIVIAHTLKTTNKTIKKGSRLSRQDIDFLAEAGFESVTGARLLPDDIDEDTAALQIATALAGSHLAISKPMGGRVNLYAEQHGVALIDRQRVEAINLGQSVITIATLPEYANAEAQQAVATVKVIPFAVPSKLLELCLESAQSEISSVISLRPYTRHNIGLILTTAPHLKTSVLESTRLVTQNRLQSMGNDISVKSRCEHTISSVSQALNEMLSKGIELILICGASVTVDIVDTIPAAITRLGGEINHFGMPVEPGNMLALGNINDCKIIVLPGCGRSPKLNGLDWVLQRYLANIDVSRQDIQCMGVGGLIKDIPLMRRRRKNLSAVQNESAKPRIAAVVLAAGLSTRMGDQNKLLVAFEQTTIIQQVVGTMTGSNASQVIVVTGHDATSVETALANSDVKFAFNEEYQKGMAGSIRTGINAITDDIDGALIVLADMPLLKVEQIDELITEFDVTRERNIVAPFKDGRRGNPVLWPRQYFADLQVLRGDRGARDLLVEYQANIWDVPIDDDAIFADFDTPESLLALR